MSHFFVAVFDFLIFGACIDKADFVLAIACPSIITHAMFVRYEYE